MKRRPLPHELVEEQKQTLITMRKGDVLYMSAGLVHEAETTSVEQQDHSVHVTFGIEIDAKVGFILACYNSLTDDLLVHLDRFRSSGFSLQPDSRRNFVSS